MSGRPQRARVAPSHVPQSIAASKAISQTRPTTTDPPHAPTDQDKSAEPTPNCSREEAPVSNRKSRSAADRNTASAESNTVIEISSESDVARSYSGLDYEDAVFSGEQSMSQSDDEPSTPPPPPPPTKKRKSRTKQPSASPETPEKHPKRKKKSKNVASSSDEEDEPIDMDITVPRVKPGGDITSHSLTVRSDDSFDTIRSHIYACMKLSDVRVKPELSARIPGMKKSDNALSLEDDNEWASVSRKVTTAYKILCRGNSAKARAAQGNAPTLGIEYLESWKHLLSQKKASNGKGVKQLIDLNADVGASDLSVDPNGLVVSKSTAYYTETMHKKYESSCGRHIFCIKIDGKCIAIAAGQMSTWIEWLAAEKPGATVDSPPKTANFASLWPNLDFEQDSAPGPSSAAAHTFDMPSSDGAPEPTWVYTDPRNPSITEFMQRLIGDPAYLHYDLDNLGERFMQQKLFALRSFRGMSVKDVQDAVPGIAYGTAKFILDKIARYFSTA
ncbi:hypothetical protein EXIGLDRAFT_705022 [Exidia glandulosa HHB12029]|uniref:Uncharacterized protein n=1 Tax=Exidia glandulosa HHB12029 TaxID=1314781 RepID=A0A165BG67_EXIGL|nr:hypothetical protein EXIGLDRAFT_705022 [Exidia glandulosa HHB12029]